ncbi:MAG: hypothetical protein R3B70_14225 [Polyangiaceae bacterium]
MGTTGAAITIERFAEMRAEMEAGKLRDDVLARHDVGADAWTAAQRSFLSEMKEELTRGRFELSNRYTSAFLSRQVVVAGESGTRHGAAGRGLDAGGAGVETGSLSANGPLGERHEVHAAGPMIGGGSGAAGGAPGAAGERRAPTMAFAMPGGQNVPFQKGDAEQGLANALRHAAATEPANKPAPAPMGGTEAAVDIGAIARRVMPFPGAGGPPGAQAASAAAPPPSVPVQAASTPVQAPSAAAPQPSMPVQAASTPVQAPSAAVSANRASAKDSTVAAFELPRGMTPGGAARAQETPFAGRASEEAAVENAKRHAEEVQKPAAGRAPIGGTVEADELAAVMRRVMPFPGGAGKAPSGAAALPAVPAGRPGGGTGQAAGPRNFTLEQYASLCEELGAAGSRAGEVLARYGVSEEERRALDAHWGRVFQGQPEMRAAWERARATYRAWLSQRR